ENVPRARAKFVGVSDGLAGNRAGADDKIVSTAGHFLGDGIGSPYIGLGIIALDLKPAAIGVTASGELLKDPIDTFIKRRDRGVLNQRDTEDFARLARP